MLRRSVSKYHDALQETALAFSFNVCLQSAMSSWSGFNGIVEQVALEKEEGVKKENKQGTDIKGSFVNDVK